MVFNFDKIIPRSNTCCEKYDLRDEIFGRSDLIPMWIADMDFESPDFIVKAIEERASHPIFGYSFRDQEYNDSITKWVARRSDWKIDSSYLHFIPGVVAGIVFAMRAFSQQGDGVVIQPPVYSPFSRMTRQNDRTLLTNPLIEKDGLYSIDFEDLDSKLSRAKIFLLCNPHNPCGRVFTRHELEKIAQLCIKHDVIIISDEIHSDIIQQPHKHIHIASLGEQVAARTITLIAPSKTFNTVGFSTAVAIIPNKNLRERFEEEFMKLHADQGNIFGAIALKAAYTHGDSWVDQMNEYVGRNMDLVVEFMAERIPNLKCRKSEGTYLLWIDFRHYLGLMSVDQLDQLLIHKAGLGLNNGIKFGSEGLGWYRMNVACPRSIVEKAMTQLDKALRDI